MEILLKNLQYIKIIQQILILMFWLYLNLILECKIGFWVEQE